jgi:Ca2+:H+ antiporter
MEDKVGKIFLCMLLFIPVSWFFSFYMHSKSLAFVTAILAIIPLARIIGFSTKEVALQTNPAFGGLINVTFGNLVELMIAIIALSAGLVEVVKASLIGSIIGNLLFLVGLSAFIGGWKYKEMKFNKTSVSVSSTMLIIAVAGLAIPSVYALTAANPEPQHVQYLSDSVAIVMALIYIAGLVFALITHNYLFDATDEIKASREKPTMSRNRALLILIAATIFVAIESELLVSGLEAAAQVIGLREVFIGAIFLGIVTNIAENANSVYFALENKIELSIEIGLSSAIQIALFVVPVLVFISQFFHYGFLLTFSAFELVALILSVIILNYITADGKTNWIEGAQLLTVYLIIAAAFYFI